jgi:hypothetical protein
MAVGWITQPEAELFLNERLLPTRAGDGHGGQNCCAWCFLNLASPKAASLETSPPPTPPFRDPGICGACKTA